MGKKHRSAPPQVPQQTQIEKDIQQQQLELMKQQLSQSQQAFQQSQADRTSLQSALQTIQNGGRQLTPEETDLINNLTNQYGKTLTDGINNGVVAQQLDRSRQQSIGDLISRGVLNSSTGAQMLGDIEKQRSMLLDDAANKTAQTRLDLTNQFRTNAMNANQASANILAGGQAQLQNYASQAAGIGSNAGAQAQQAAYAQRMAEYQRSMGAWQYNQSMPKTNWGGIIGTLGGAALGSIGGIPGATLGATLGGGLGSIF